MGEAARRGGDKRVKQMEACQAESEEKLK